MEQTEKRYGNRISILGLWEPGKKFDYALSQGGFKGESYIKVMNWEAKKSIQDPSRNRPSNRSSTGQWFLT
jgi:putative transposase